MYAKDEKYTKNYFTKPILKTKVFEIELRKKGLTITSAVRAFCASAEWAG
jgi:hypothetical protein